MTSSVHPAGPWSLAGRRVSIILGAAAAVAAISLNPGSAQAYEVTVGNIRYDITTFTSSPLSAAAKFQTPANGGVMPWYGNAELAQSFATGLKGNLGYPNCQIAGGCGGGPFFAHERQSGGFTNSFLWYQSTNALRGPQGNLAGQFRTFAQAAFIGYIPVPGPLPLFGAAAAFGFSRKLRTRIQGSRRPLATSQPLT